MNRTMHLRETFPRNIADNIGYGNIEFVLLNYNSSDDLHEWVQTAMAKYLEQGILKYYHTREPQFFQMSHAKNMVFRLAAGDILCGIDADNFTGPGFAEYVNERFVNNRQIYLQPPAIGDAKKYWDVQGRVAVHRDDFHAVHGYDEAVQEYGFEDQDFKKRLQLLGCSKHIIKAETYLQAIPHEDRMRIKGGMALWKLQKLFYCQAPVPEIIYLQDNNMYEKVTVDHHLLCNDATTFLKTPIKKIYAGNFLYKEDKYHLYKKNNENYLTLSPIGDGSLLSQDERVFQPIYPGELGENFLFQRAMYLSKKIYLSNRNQPKIINSNGYGKGTVQEYVTKKTHLLA